MFPDNELRITLVIPVISKPYTSSWPLRISSFVCCISTHTVVCALGCLLGFQYPSVFVTFIVFPCSYSNSEPLVTYRRGCSKIVRWIKLAFPKCIERIGVLSLIPCFSPPGSQIPDFISNSYFTSRSQPQHRLFVRLGYHLPNLLRPFVSCNKFLFPAPCEPKFVGSFLRAGFDIDNICLDANVLAGNGIKPGEADYSYRKRTTS